MAVSAFRREARPWTRWWWMGNALTRPEITRCLTEFREAGFGGVEVSPIYGPTNAEERFVPFLSAAWLDLFAFTLEEAGRLDLGVDLIAGTGWPFGGPWVSDEDAARRVWVERYAPGSELSRTDAVLLARHDTENAVFALWLAPTGQQVKRAAPGGAGYVLDHFNPEAVERYFQALNAIAPPRCFFNDSWEVFGANGTLDICGEFQQRRGYSLDDALSAFAGDDTVDRIQRVRSDYRETIHDLTAAFLTGFGRWAHGRGSRIRNQAHGSPGNLLDLYALGDIPETEIFGPLYPNRALPAGATAPSVLGQGEEALLCRFASSAAYTTGKALVSSESFTWLGEHGHVSLRDMKEEVDLLFCLGINHIFFHGTPYSPADAPWPGWLFYASTHCAPTNPWWSDLSALNDYIARCQTALQEGVPDNDLLLYFPFHDLLASETGAQADLQFMSVHRTSGYLRGSLPRFVETARQLTEDGWTFDLVSDRQLQENITVNEDGTLTATGGALYRAILLTGCERVPPETMERLVDLAAAGACVLFPDDLPTEVPGLATLPARRDRLQAALQRLQACNTAGLPLAEAGMEPETLPARGISFLRRRVGEEWVYFLVNTGEQTVDSYVSLTRSTGAKTALLHDPLTGHQGRTPVTPEGVRIALAPGESAFLRFGETSLDLPPWHYATPLSDTPPVLLENGWEVTFTAGGPTSPPDRILPSLTDWTTWSGQTPDETESLRAFSGTARYRIVFDLPQTGIPGYWLDLGTVCHSARTWLNGEFLGTRFAPPYRYPVPTDLLRPDGNLLEIDVTNLMANRLADQERRQGESWRPFLLVNIHYKPFDAATWPAAPSGLLGPVRLIPLQE